MHFQRAGFRSIISIALSTLVIVGSGLSSKTAIGSENNDKVVVNEQISSTAKPSCCELRTLVCVAGVQAISPAELFSALNGGSSEINDLAKDRYHRWSAFKCESLVSPRGPWEVCGTNLTTDGFAIGSTEQHYSNRPGRQYRYNVIGQYFGRSVELNDGGKFTEIPALSNVHYFEAEECTCGDAAPGAWEGQSKKEILSLMGAEPNRKIIQDGGELWYYDSQEFRDLLNISDGLRFFFNEEGVVATPK